MEDSNNQLLDRREFNGLCTAPGLSLPAVSAMFTGLSGAMAFGAANDVDSPLSGCCLDPLYLSFQSFHRYAIALRNEPIDARA